MSFFDAALREERWALEVDEFVHDPIIVEGAGIMGPSRGSVLEVRLSDGSEIRRSQRIGSGQLVGCAKGLLVLHDLWELRVVRWDGSVLWQLAGVSKPIALGEGFLVAARRGGRSITCRELESGVVQWEFDVPAEGEGKAALASNVLSPGMPSMFVESPHVVLLLADGRMLALREETGEIATSARSPLGGVFTVTGEGVFYKNPFQCVAFERGTLHPKGSWEYRTEVEPLYEGNLPSVHGFTVTEEAIYWTTRQASVMAVERETAGERRAAEAHHVSGAAFSLGEAPIASSSHLYVTSRGEPAQLICYERN